MRNTSSSYPLFPVGKTVHELFELQTTSTPDTIAIRYGDQQLSYVQLNAKANQLAHFLLKHGVKTESLIAISMERSVEMIIGILGILKAGAAYVPIDHRYPTDRINYMLDDSGADLLISQHHLLEFFPGTITAVCLDTEWSIIQKQSTDKPDISVTPQQLIYTIYTSGSTGRPKGVMVEHHNVVNLVEGQIKRMQHPVDQFLYAYSFAFDGAVLLIYWTLLSGGTLVIAPEDLEKDIHQLADFISSRQISHLLTFPSLYGLLLDQVEHKKLRSLESVSVAGEACPTSLVHAHFEKAPQARLFNQYGPTEATVGATIYEVPKSLGGNKVPIGTCIDNVYIRLLDENNQEVQEGIAGEVCIGGAGVARGYLNNKELTFEKFIQDPFSQDPNTRLYRTGDLARRLPSGQLDFIGRIDFQVKLRGYRIELGEIEAILAQHPAILEVVVDIRGEKSEDQQLICWWATKKGQETNLSTLRSFAAEKLPDYMLPSQWIEVNNLPKAASGKIDRNALPAPNNQRPNLNHEYQAPSKALEKRLVAIWESILQIQPIGIHDKFFELGGNSLQAARFISQVQEFIGENIFIVSIFDYPTIATYATFLEKEYLNDRKDISDSLSKAKTQQSQSKSLNTRTLKARDFNRFQQYIPELSKFHKSKDKNTQAVFILAPPRSGTTLLRVMLAGHPKLFAANELQLLGFHDLRERAEAYQDKFSLWSEGLLRTIMELQQCNANQAQTIVDDWTNKNWTTQQVYAELQSWINNQILIDKSPSYALDPKTLQKAEIDFEQTLYIHLVRHPYAMIRSFEKMHMSQAMYLHPHPFNGKEIGEFIWTQSHRNTINFLQSIPQERQFCLTYEDLVTQPEKMMRQLCDRFGWDYHEALILPYRNIDKKMVDGLHQDSKPMGDIRLLEHRAIDPQLANKWKGVSQDNFLSEITWTTAHELGYPVIAKNKPTPLETLSTNSTTTDIAIIGMSCRFPGAKNTKEFWQNLEKGVDVSTVFSQEDLIAAGLDPELINHPDYVRRGMILEDADCFDASFFGYLPKEAALMDPQHRIYLECAYAALEDAAYDPERFRGKIGVFGGVARNTYLVNNVLTHPNYFKSLDDFQLGITLEKDFPATRVAYKLNLKGAAVNVQTACSSSGVALHLACQSLLSGDNDIVLVGGGRIQPPLNAGHLHKDGHALSPDGYCRAFDENAQGMVRGHGMAFLVLKPLSKAKADGDHIHAVIKATAINNDGSDKIGFTAPSINGQAEAIREAYEKAGFSPDSVSYVEAHGTGTRLGDPIEIAGLTKAFQQYTNKKQFCAIGSVKTNIGHLDAGACIAGIIKTTLAMKYGLIPANLHFSKPNPQIQFEQTPFFVNDQLRKWKSGKTPRRAGISSFGLGGTNAHILLEEAPKQEVPNTGKSYHLLLLSAKTDAALDKKTIELGRFLAEKEMSLSNVAHTLQHGRSFFGKRRFLIANDQYKAAQQFIQLDRKHCQTTLDIPVERAKIVFMFPGGGAQHVNMGRDLYENELAFQLAVDQCLQLLKDKYNLDYKESLYPVNDQESNAPIHDPLSAITLLFIIEYATTKLWEDWGIKPDQIIGHSLGEYTAACITGILSLEDTLALVVKRGQLFQQLDKGTMLSVAMTEQELKPLLNGHLSIAAINKPNLCVASGPIEEIASLADQLDEMEIEHRRLHISVAAHSQMIEAILPEFNSFLQDINFGESKTPIISNLSGNWAVDEDLRSANYWSKHLRHGVRFAEGLTTILQQDNCILIEVGPGQTLSNFARQHPAKTKQHLILASLRHPKEVIHDRAFILKTCGRLWLENLDLNWTNITGQNQRRVSLPTYPFERQRHWLEAKPSPHTSTHSKQANPTLNTNTPILNRSNTQTNSNMSVPAITRKELIVEQLKDLFHQMSGIPQEEMDSFATFLELGFDSLMLTQVTARLKKQYQVDLSFRQLFEEMPDIDHLASFLDSELSDEYLKDELTAKQAKSSPDGIINSNLPTPITSPVNTPKIPSPPQTIVHQSQPGSLEAIVQQQLYLMQQQLNLLSGETASKVYPLPQDKATPNANENVQETIKEKAEERVEKKNNSDKNSSKSNQVQKEKEGLAHGPWKPISKKGNDGLTPQQRQYLNELIRRYTTRTNGSQQLTQSQRPHLADPRSITGFSRLWKDMVYQIAVDKSKGSKVWDIDGNEYVDYRMAFGISLFGHTPDFVQQAIYEQTEKGIELGVLTPLANKVAKLLAELSGKERVTFVNTGSEALSAAVRIARTATGKDKIAIFQEDYHGIADEFLVKRVGPIGKGRNIPVAPGIPQFLVDNVLVLKYDDPDILDTLAEHADELAAIVIEPIQPNNPTHQPKQLFQDIRKLTLENDIAMVFDEMITGFRVAQGGAQEWYDIEVDIVAYGKIISGGLPMAAVAGSARFMDCFDGGMWHYGDDSIPEKGVTFFGGTFVRHPLCMASAYAALSEIKRQGSKLYQDLNAKSARFAEQLKELFIKTKVPLRVHSTASIVAIQVTDKNPLSRLFFYYARLKGVHIKEKAALVSTAHTEEDLNFTVRVFEECIREMQTAGFFPLTVAEVEDQNKIIYPPEHNAIVEEIEGEKKKLPLTEGQQEVWVEQRLGQEAAAAYNLSSVFILRGQLDFTALDTALQQLVARHEALRVYFVEDSTHQIILPKVKIPLPHIDLSGKSDSEQQYLLEELKQAEVNTALDIFKGPLVRAQIISLSLHEHHLLMTAHHAIADGWSWGILAHDLAELYSAIVERRSASLGEARQLSQFVQQLTGFEKSDAFIKTENFWINQYKNGVPILEFPTDRSRPSKKTYHAALEKHLLDEGLIRSLKQVAAKQRTTLFFLMYTAFQTFIHRLSRQDDFVLGLVAAGQANGGNQHLVGHAVSLLPLRTQVNPQDTFAVHLKKMRGHLLDAFEHQHYTLGALVKKLQLPRDPSRQPLISFLFNMDTPGGDLHFTGLEVEQEPIPRGYETFDSFINLKPEGQSIVFEWIYNTDLFYQETIKRHLKEFETMLLGIVKHADTPIYQLPLIPESEFKQLTNWQSLPSLDFPQDKTIDDLFLATVKKFPNRIAVNDGTKKLTYQELNIEANRLAQVLIREGVNPADFVGIYLERSTDLLIALLATLKVGGIYVPLDPANPMARLQVILEDAEANVIISHKGMSLEGFKGQTIRIESAKSLQTIEESFFPKTNNQQFAYVNYTSGSSGKPKGALFTHYQVIDHHFAIIEALQLGSEEVFFNVASIAFDPSVQDYFLPLFLGGQVYISPEKEKTDGFLLKAALEKENPTLMQATPSTWRMLISAGWKGNKDQLKILSGGEGLNKELANQLISRSQSLYNIYGPTETTIWSTLKKLEGDRLTTQAESGYEPIGKPLRNVQIYLLDEHQQEVPIGVAGEIYIGGIGVAKEGYFKRPELTKEKFIIPPFAQQSKQILYRTGDLGRYLANGDLEYLQRADRQVKIRGFRIELGEIEAAIAQHSDIEENVVMIREDQPGSPRLVAYYVPKQEKSIQREHLKAFLQEKLPAFMLPGIYVSMDAFPLTATLKIDRNQLPVPTTDEQAWERPFVAPRTHSEKVLHSIWQEVLNLQRISIDDNFFDLGGHSLIAVKMMSQVTAITEKKLPLACLLEKSTIRSLAKELDKNQERLTEGVRSLIPIRKTGSRTPLYLVHGAGLHVLMYETLARHMDEDQPIYGLQARGLYGEAKPLDRIEDMAAHYIAEILEQNPNGPYALAGYSFGGLLAFEMAKQLEAKGKTVSLLGMFDTVVREQITGNEQSNYYEQLSTLGKKVAWNLSLLARNPIANIKYKTNSLTRIWKRWRWNLSHNEEEELNNQHTDHVALVDRMNKIAFDNYRIAPYTGKVHLFKAKEQRFFMSDFEYMGWKPFAKSGVIVHEVPGDHLNMFNPPHGEQFAKILQEALNEVKIQNLHLPKKQK